MIAAGDADLAPSFSGSSPARGLQDCLLFCLLLSLRLRLLLDELEDDWRFFEESPLFVFLCVPAMTFYCWSRLR